MAGLINQQMGGVSSADEQNEQEPVEGMGPDGSAQHEGMEGEQPEANDTSNVDEDTDPGFQQALEFAFSALYEGKAAKDIAEQLKHARSMSEGMADVAYNITSIADEQTQGAVPDELLMAFAMRILEEVGTIAEAAGMNPTPEDVAGAFKTMILRYMGEQGIDTTQLQQAMDQVDPSVFANAEAEQA